jgi:hypothetical protein
MNERRSAGLIVGLVSERHCCAFLFGLLWRMPLQCQSSTLIRRITKPYMSINYSYHTYIITYIHNYKIHYSVIMTSCVAQNCFEIFDTWCVESTHICWCADRDYIWCDVECWSCAPRLPAHSSLSWLVWAVMFFFYRDQSVWCLSAVPTETMPSVCCGAVCSLYKHIGAFRGWTSN